MGSCCTKAIKNIIIRITGIGRTGCVQHLSHWRGNLITQFYCHLKPSIYCHNNLNPFLDATCIVIISSLDCNQRTQFNNSSFFQDLNNYKVSASKPDWNCWNVKIIITYSRFIEYVNLFRFATFLGSSHAQFWSIYEPYIKLKAVLLSLRLYYSFF